jgi:hypothetical protein
MKDLGIKKYHAYQCDYCKRIMKSKKGIQNHERICYKNDNRTCDECGEDGGNYVFYGDYDYWQICHTCSTAYSLGIKNFLIQEDIDKIEKDKQELPF